MTHNIEIFDSIAVIAHYTAGVRILNISDPVNPVEIAWYDTRPQDNDNIFQGCWGVYKFPSGKIIASDSSNGLFVLRIDMPTDISNNISNPVKYSLEQNFPNPFNPVTQLEFGISDLGFVTLKVFDILGKEVKTLVNEIKPAGRYKVEFNGSILPSGIYFYQMEIGNFVSTKKMLMIK